MSSARTTQLELGISARCGEWPATRSTTARVIDLDGLPPGFGGGMGRCHSSTRSQSRQFVEWKRAGAGDALTTPREAAHRISHRLGSHRSAPTAQICKSSTQCSSTRTPRGAGADSCCATSATRGRRHVAAATIASALASTSRRAARPAARGAPAAASEHGSVRRRTASDADEAPALSRRRRGARWHGCAISAVQFPESEQVPAYVVFPDRTLAEMAVRRPTTSGALANVRGVGPANSRGTATVFWKSSVRRRDDGETDILDA